MQYQQLNEELKENDLHNLIDNIFEVDNFASKMGSDKDIVVVSFTVESHEPALDLVNFIERGYEFVLDADSSPGELKDGKYKVFVELERNRRVSEHIMEILDGVGKLTGIDNFKFRYYKNFQSIPVTQETLSEAIPVDSNDYEIKIKESTLNNFSNFFNKSYLENISVEGNDLIFQKKYSDPLRMRIQQYGRKEEVYSSAPGKIMIESRDVSEIMFLTKYLGNYNITKIGNRYIFENQGYAIALEMI